MFEDLLEYKITGIFENSLYQDPAAQEKTKIVRKQGMHKLMLIMKTLMEEIDPVVMERQTV